MEEDIKILENLKENVALFSGGWQPILKQEEKQAIENLINRNKELERQVDLEYVEENYIEKSKVITKSKVEEKIEELKFEIEKCKDLYTLDTKTKNNCIASLVYKKEVLQELLEE